MSYYSIDGIFHNIENFSQDTKNNPLKKNFTKDISVDFKPAFNQFKKDLKTAVNLLDTNDNISDINNVTSYLNKNNFLRFYDKKKNEVILKVNKNNEICIAKSDREVCLKDEDFILKVDNSINQNIKKENKLKQEKKKEITGLEIKFPVPKPKKEPKKPNVFINY